MVSRQGLQYRWEGRVNCAPYIHRKTTPATGNFPNIRFCTVKFLAIGHYTWIDTVGPTSDLPSVSHISQVNVQYKGVQHT